MELDLDSNGIGDLKPLAAPVSLATPNLGQDRVPDISHLAGLTGLTKLTVRGNPLSRESVQTHIPEIRARGVRASRENPDAE